VSITSSVSLLGSRALGSQYAGLVRQVIAALHVAGVSSFNVPCGRGAAAFARSALAERGLSFVLFAASAFPSSSWVGSLARRSAACVRSSQILVVFLASPSSVGSLSEIRLGVSLHLPVFVFCCGFGGGALPALGGSWRIAEGPLGALGAWRWYPLASQGTLCV